MHHKVNPYKLSGSTQTIGPNNAAKTQVYYFGGVVEAAAGSVIITDNSGTVIDQIWGTTTAAGKSWLGPNGVLCDGPLTVTVTGTVAGSLYLA
jgi:hypothetical protein